MPKVDLAYCMTLPPKQAMAYRRRAAAPHAQRSGRRCEGSCPRHACDRPGSDIPARPFLPLLADGSLQSEVRDEIHDVILRHLKKAATA